MIIAIDGPAGSGKTTIAKLLAKRLGFSYLDTGATYRSLTLKALEADLDLGDECALSDLAGSLSLNLENDKVYLDGEDVSAEIRAPRIDKNISLVVSFPKVRELMVQLQRKIAENRDFVVEGRDITTVVFANAEFKFYLDADFEARAQRRFKELTAKGIDIDFHELKKDLKTRDKADMGREIGPLRLAPDAVKVDTTGLTIEQVVEKIIGYIGAG